MASAAKGLVECRNCGVFILSSDFLCHHCRAEQPVYSEVRSAMNGVKAVALIGVLALFAASVIFVLVNQDNLGTAALGTLRSFLRVLSK